MRDAPLGIRQQLSSTKPEMEKAHGNSRNLCGSFLWARRRANKVSPKGSTQPSWSNLKHLLNRTPQVTKSFSSDIWTAQ